MLMSWNFFSHVETTVLFLSGGILLRVVDSESFFFLPSALNHDAKLTAQL